MLETAEEGISRRDEADFDDTPLLGCEEQQDATRDLQEQWRGLPVRERRPQPRRADGAEAVPADADAGPVLESTTWDRHQRHAPRPARRATLARPTPHQPITDPFAVVCKVIRRPKYGHQYILCPDRPRRQRGDPIGLSVGPHWSGIIYTSSIIAFITLFVVRVVLIDVSPGWFRPAAVVCSVLIIIFLVATAIADPGIVVQGAEAGEGYTYCEECSIWTPRGAAHCEECGVCIFGLDHHCPWMGKCVGRDNILWFRLFNGTWIVSLSCLLVAMPYVNNHKISNGPS